MENGFNIVLKGTSRERKGKEVRVVFHSWGQQDMIKGLQY